jgi:hypothetical protein
MCFIRFKNDIDHFNKKGQLFISTQIKPDISSLIFYGKRQDCGKTTVS